MKRCVSIVIAGVVLAISGCGLSIPADPDGTLDDARGGTLRVGVSENRPFTVVDDGVPSGTEVDAVEEFAATIDADIEWTVDSEEALVRGLEDDTVDLVIAGLTDTTPWIDKAGVTRAYTEVTGGDGKTYKLVMLVQMGENAFLTELETFLAEYTGEIG